MMMADHAKQVVWEFFTTKHDDPEESMSAKIEGLLDALNDYVGAPVTTGFSATIASAPAAKAAKS
jgi:hypothetical protein